MTDFALWLFGASLLGTLAYLIVSTVNGLELPQ